MLFSQYDAVRIIAFSAMTHTEADVFNRRPPRVGDVATVVELYSSPPGYELECSDENGITEWLVASKSTRWNWNSWSESAYIQVAAQQYDRGGPT
jgi:hypothetical protein